MVKLICGNCKHLIPYKGKVKLTDDLNSQCNNRDSLYHERIMMKKESCNSHSRIKQKIIIKQEYLDFLKGKNEITLLEFTRKFLLADSTTAAIFKELEARKILKQLPREHMAKSQWVIV